MNVLLKADKSQRSSFVSPIDYCILKQRAVCIIYVWGYTEILPSQQQQQHRRVIVILNYKLFKHCFKRWVECNAMQTFNIFSYTGREYFVIKPQKLYIVEEKWLSVDIFISCIIISRQWLFNVV